MFPWNTFCRQKMSLSGPSSAQAHIVFASAFSPSPVHLPESTENTKPDYVNP